MTIVAKNHKSKIIKEFFIHFLNNEGQLESVEDFISEEDDYNLELLDKGFDTEEEAYEALLESNFPFSSAVVLPLISKLTPFTTE